MTEDETNDNELKDTIEEIKSNINVRDILPQNNPDLFKNISKNITFSFDFKTNIISASLIHDWNNSSRHFDRIYDAYYRIDSVNP